MHHLHQSPGTPPEAVHVMRDPATGLEGVIVLHSTRLGAAAGGCRLWRYPDAAAAVTDAATQAATDAAAVLDPANFDAAKVNALIDASALDAATIGCARLR